MEKIPFDVYKELKGKGILSFDADCNNIDVESINNNDDLRSLVDDLSNYLDDLLNEFEDVDY